MNTQYFMDIFKAMEVRDDMLNNPAFSDFLLALDSVYKTYTFGGAYFKDERPHFSKTDTGYMLQIPNSRDVDSKMIVSIENGEPTIIFEAHGSAKQLNVEDDVDEVNYDETIPDILKGRRLSANMKDNVFSFTLDYAEAYEGGSAEVFKGDNKYVSKCLGFTRKFDKNGIEIERNTISSPSSAAVLPPRIMNTASLLKTLDRYYELPNFTPFFGYGVEVNIRRINDELAERIVKVGRDEPQHMYCSIIGEKGSRLLNVDGGTKIESESSELAAGERKLAA